jgi:hypothetical protein
LLSLFDQCRTKKHEELKASMMEEKGFTLIAIPFWWENDDERYHICFNYFSNAEISAPA